MPAAETKTSLSTDANAAFPDNVIGLITPAILRTWVLNLVQSYLDTNTVPASSTAPAGTALMGPSSGGAAVPSFRQPANTDILAPAQTILANSTTATGTASSTVAAFKTMAGIPISITDPAFGADPTGAVDATTAIQAAVNSLGSTGGTILIPPGIYRVNGTITISNPMTIRGANLLGNAANIFAGGANNNVFIINSSYVTIEGVYISRAGAPGVGNAITVGNDVVQLTNVHLAAASTTLTCASASFSASDVGKAIYIPGAGALTAQLFSTIASRNSPTEIQIAAAATTSIASGPAAYGYNYDNLYFNNLQVVNHALAFDVQAMRQSYITNCYLHTNSCIKLQNMLTADQGTNWIYGNFLASVDTVNGIGVWHISGGDLHVSQNKFQGGKWGYHLDWSYQTSGLTQLNDNGFEGQVAAAVYCTAAFPFVRLQVNDNNAALATTGVGNLPFLQVSTTSTGTISQLVSAGNTIVYTTGSNVFDIGRVDQFVLGPNLIDGGTGAVGNAYRIRAQASNGRVVLGQENVGTILSNGGTNVVTSPTINNSGLGGFATVTLTSLGVDQAINIAPLGPASGFAIGTNTRFRIPRIIISSASTDISAATFGVFQTTGSAQAIVTGSTAITVTTAAANTNNNMQVVVPANTSTQTFSVSQVFFRTQATLAGGTATVYVETEFLP